MTDYVGMKCPVCGKTFSEHDDIVVCPDCGAPYHRECYAQAGKCIFADKHGTPDAWTPPRPQTESENKNDDRPVRRCPRCGFPNPENALFCQHCGAPLSEQHPAPGGFPPDGGYIPFGGYSPYGMPQGPNQPGGFQDPQVPFVFDPMGGVDPNEPIDGVPAGDVAKLVQNNTQYYLPVFMGIKRFGRNRFNFSGFLFSGGWMLYRKQYRAGSVITAIMAALYLLSSYITLNFTGPLYETLMQQAGISGDSVSLSYAQLLQISELLSRQSWDKILWFFLPTLISLVQFVIMLIVGFNGNKWYLNHCVKKTETIRRESQNASESAVRFQEEGGVNTALAICLLICYMIIMYIPLGL